jgi:hypothetical protein
VGRNVKSLKILYILVAVSIIVMATLLSTMNPWSQQTYNQSPSSSAKHHFSVKWMGYAPDNNATWPVLSPYYNYTSDYYICINDVASSTLSIPVSFKLVNQENNSFYFRTIQNPSSPSAWSSQTSNIGLVNKDATRFFTFNTERSKPTSIPAGMITETLILTVQAYYDSAYTQFYSQDNIPITFHLIDRTSSAWSILSVNNFDTSPITQWSGIGTLWSGPTVTSELYRSWPNSSRIETWVPGSENGFGKTIILNSSYTEAYVVVSIRTGNWLATPKVTFNGTVVFEPDIAPTSNLWYQLTFPVPVNQATQVNIYFASGSRGYSYLDDAYLIAR